MIDNQGVAILGDPAVENHLAGVDSLHRSTILGLDVHSMRDLGVAVFRGDTESAYDRSRDRPWKVPLFFGHALIGEFFSSGLYLLDEPLYLFLVCLFLLAQRGE